MFHYSAPSVDYKDKFVFQEVSGSPQLELLIKAKLQFYISAYFFFRNFTLKELLQTVRKCELQKHKGYPAAEW